MFNKLTTKRFIFILAPFVLLLSQSCSVSPSSPKGAGFYDPQISSDKADRSVKKNKLEQSKKRVTSFSNEDTVKKENKSIFFIDSEEGEYSNSSKYPSFIGEASWYGPGFHGKKTASGEIYNENALTVAHRTLPLGTKIKLVNLENNKTVFARVNDRGPFIDGRMVDGSKRVAEILGYKNQGLAKVKLIVIDDGKNNVSRVVSNQQASNLSAPKTNYRSVAGNSLIADENSYVVQLGSFKNKTNAYKFKDTLETSYLGLPFLINMSDQKYFQVLTGPFPSKKDAERIAGEFTKKGMENLVRFYGNI